MTVVFVENMLSEEIIKELCVCNGVNHDKIAQEGPATRMLEMFFFGYPKMVGLSCFPNLTSLTLVGQNIESIAGLECCPQLQELWIAECRLTKIEGLQDCHNLKRLFLYCNSITAIDNLEHLSQLEVLWLNDNQIEVIEGLELLQNLIELSLAGNLIHSIGHCLDPNVRLERLNLSGNKISSFKELTNLARLNNLKDLGLKDPQYPPNPVCLFYNYSTHVLYHMPQLQRLDTYDVSPKLIKDLAESTVMKKKMYYNMRVKTVQRQLREELEKLKEQRCKVEEVALERMSHLLFQVKSLERDLLDRQLSENQKNSSRFLEYSNFTGDLEESDSWGKNESNRTDSNLEQKTFSKIRALRERIKFWASKMEEIDFYHEKEVTRRTEGFDLLVRFLQTELETVGNVRFEEGSPSDSWFQTCYDLILSRFCASNFKSLGISGVKIKRIVRVHNRILRSKFEDRVQDCLDAEDSVTNENYKKMLEYLFYTVDPREDLLEILEDGFNYRKTMKMPAQEQGDCILLSNSLGFSEASQSEQASTLETNNYNPKLFKHGTLIIVKVFLGRSVQARDNLPINLQAYPTANSVYRPLKLQRISLCPSDDETCPSEEHRSCDCSLRRCDWFVFDPELILPEYIVEYEYIPLETSVGSAALSSSQSENVSGEVTLDEDTIAMEPVIKARPKIISLDESTILSIAKASAYTQITILNLHGNSLSKLKEISKLHGLRKLIISFNEFSNLEDVSGLPNLEFLDASHNHVTTLEGLNRLGKLKHLDISWNQLTRTREDMNILHKQTPHLLSVHIAHNPWQKPASVRLVAIGRLKSLTHMDGAPITDEEAAESAMFFTGGRITQAVLLTNARTDTVKPRCLSLLPSAQILSEMSDNCLDPYAELSNRWYDMVTSINMDGQKLSKITNLEKLGNLRWATFNNNYLTKIEGLERCVSLEELYLDGNCITKLEGLSKLVKLRHLSINDNQLTSFDKDIMDNLSHLHFLSAENNNISTLAGLQKAHPLIELYLSNNRINNNQEVYHLKGLSNLVILDLYGNPISRNNDNYRLFVIFHLPSLKALDGSAVDQLESENAKDVFGGRLSSDMIAEKLGYQNFTELQELNWRSSSIRSVDLVPADQFKAVHTVNLENNNLTSFSGLIFLSHLKNLYLNYNHIESILPRQKSQNHLTNRQILHQKVNSSGYGQQSKANRDALFGETLTPIMQSLEVLHLGYNGISNLPQLQLGRLRNLKLLYLQGNEISHVEGLDGLQFLQELILDHNRIKHVTETSFAKLSSLVSLRLEENRLRDVNNLLPLIQLRKLFIGCNKIQEISEIEKLEAIPALSELSISGNPLSRKMFHRQLVILRLQNLQILDGIAVTNEEKARAEMHFLEQQALLGANPVMEMVYPASTLILAKPPPLRITNVCLPGGIHHFPGSDLHLNNPQDDLFPNDSNKYKKSKNNPRSGNPEIAFRPFRAAAPNISTPYLTQQQAGPYRGAQVGGLEHEGRSHGNGNLRQNRM
ncbi:leucine-rich repeat-containing protein 9 [Hyperolius riggenbachi]|uniref:leucine-rich repeat-containing protein 9 n=1 Tax=Hyperolius riggenbachi TaxID=752182 RepID=UPI0035A3AF66